MRPTFNRNVFLALATVAWADGVLAPEEREGILRAAQGAGFSAEELAELDAAIQQRRDLASLNLGKLSALDRVFVYATAVWLAQLDGVVEAGEREALRQLAERLMLSERVQGAAAATATDVAKLPAGDRPDKYDLVKLKQLLDVRLSQRR